MDLDLIQKLMDKLEASKLSKLAVKQGEFELTLEKECAGRAPAPRAVEHHFEAAPQEKRSAIQHGATVNSPMVGTFYRSPGPSEKKFVNLHEMVAKGDTLCIIEAMKVMNEIKSDVSGKIVEILVEDGHSVEFGQPLFRVE